MRVGVAVIEGVGVSGGASAVLASVCGASPWEPPLVLFFYHYLVLKLQNTCSDMGSMLRYRSKDLSSAHLLLDRVIQLLNRAIRYSTSVSTR